MREKITLRLIGGLAPDDKDRFVWDTVTTGFGLKLTRSGSLIYVVQTRLGGVLRRVTIGKHGAPWTPETARREAVCILGRIADGDMPESAREKRRKDMSVAELCDLYLAEGCHLKKPSTLATDRGRIARHIKPLLGRRKVREVSRAQVERFMTDVATGRTATDVRTGLRGRAIVKGGKGTASRTVGLLGGIFQFAVDRGLIEANPVRGVKRYPDRKFERFLSASELAALGAALREAEETGSESHYAIAAIRFLLLTGCRKGEALTLRWSWIDFERALIRFPDSKTGAKVLALGAPAQALLSSVPRVEGNPFVFAASKGEGPLPRLPEAWENIRANAGLDGVRLHDLRHSFASVGAASGDSLLIIGRLLGHRNASSTERYSHLSDDPLRSAATRIGATIMAALNGNARAEIVRLGKSTAHR